MTSFRRRICRSAAWAAVASFTLGCLAANTNTSRFGFTGPEIFPIENQISQLHVADLDGDGLYSTFEIAGQSAEGGEPFVLPMEVHREVD